jgi:D-alanyl-D-alanine carboxypeptidase (penicillin-binding protein 5/6)
VGAEGFGILSDNGTQTPKPTASVAKLVTALAVLDKYPLSLGQQGPVITFGASDIALYQKYIGLNGSVVKVEVGEQITEYQALQAMLLPSANNIADSLATWAYGSMEAYVKQANLDVKSLGLAHTIIADDASGFSPSTTSTPDDLVILGLKVMSSPILANIVAQKNAIVPIVGEIQNVNNQLGTDGIVGIKTGNTDQAGGVYVFAANYLVPNGHQVAIVGSIMGASTLRLAMNEALPILQTTENNFNVVRVINKNQIIGEYGLDWQKNINIVAQSNVDILTWGNEKITPSYKINVVKSPSPEGTVVGQITLSNNNFSVSTPLIIDKPIKKSPWTWRVFRKLLDAQR